MSTDREVGPDAGLGPKGFAVILRGVGKTDFLATDCRLVSLKWTMPHLAR